MPFSGHSGVRAPAMTMTQGAVSVRDEGVLGVRRAVDEVPLPERALLALDE